ncbi:hypothetical protein BA953_00865 [Vibrio coralliilyticus]|uniref:hypothetical protein n=1 Tax=Vibrio coralliilyticus TaxID=190893 RepID=UPI000810ACA7|nr:hypothetical protein [Vibrio coralliilyticus]ANW22865.1 hypothetical protein BA953_00865 [Vibrio coralliilyticus]
MTTVKIDSPTVDQVINIGTAVELNVSLDYELGVQALEFLINNSVVGLVEGSAIAVTGNIVTWNAQSVGSQEFLVKATDDKGNLLSSDAVNFSVTEWIDGVKSISESSDVLNGHYRLTAQNFTQMILGQTTKMTLGSVTKVVGGFETALNLTNKTKLHMMTHVDFTLGVKIKGDTHSHEFTGSKNVLRGVVNKIKGTETDVSAAKVKSSATETNVVASEVNTLGTEVSNVANRVSSTASVVEQKLNSVNNTAVDIHNLGTSVKTTQSEIQTLQSEMKTVQNQINTIASVMNSSGLTINV